MSVSQAVAQGKGRGRRERGPAWHRATTRKAILEAAREMIASDGIEETSLIRVAEKAGFAPTTVYAYFVRRADLISAIVADDLASFARAIIDGFPFAEPDEQDLEPESIEPEEPAEAEPAAAPVPVPTNDYLTTNAADETLDAIEVTKPEDVEILAPEAVEVSAPQDSASAFADCATDYEEPESDEPDPAANVATDDVPVANFEVQPQDEEPVVTRSETADAEPAKVSNDSGAISALEARLAQIEARRVDPWLERRLREFERMLGALDERIGANDRGGAATTAPVEGRLQSLCERFEAFEKTHVASIEENAKTLLQDLEVRDARLRQSSAELRTLILESSGRLDVLERDRELKALAVEMPSLDFVPSLDEPARQPEEPVPSETTPDESYLAAARRAAQTAQTLAQSDDRARARRGFSWIAARTRMLLAFCIGLGIVLAVTGMALRERSVVLAKAIPPRLQVARNVTRPVTTAPVAAVSTADVRAQSELGLAYLDGHGVAQSDTNAARLLTSAASSGDPVAQYWLATLFEHGRGEPADPAAAIRWYEAAALQGNLKAMYKLAVSYAEGWGTRKNYSEAARWFSRAAELGFVNAQFNLGVLYERGLGVPQSLLDAYKWYALAAAQGDRDSASRIDALSSQLSAEDLATARDAVQAFRPQPRDVGANALPAAAPGADMHASRN